MNVYIVEHVATGTLSEVFEDRQDAERFIKKSEHADKLNNEFEAQAYRIIVW